MNVTCPACGGSRLRRKKVRGRWEAKLATFPGGPKVVVRHYDCDDCNRSVAVPIEQVERVAS